MLENESEGGCNTHGSLDKCGHTHDTCPDREYLKTLESLESSGGLAKVEGFKNNNTPIIIKRSRPGEWNVGRVKGLAHGGLSVIVVWRDKSGEELNKNPDTTEFLQWQEDALTDETAQSALAEIQQLNERQLLEKREDRLENVDSYMGQAREAKEEKRRVIMKGIIDRANASSAKEIVKNKAREFAQRMEADSYFDIDDNNLVGTLLDEKIRRDYYKGFEASDMQDLYDILYNRGEE
ncbi:MAG: hypothetical protein A3B90_00605 [Candidatus Magasanikbacteria bacterium RIFCSPHIGHO2_02_FULL_41_13]|uniref:Uncharacterized protein n=1 Tax=Candidatus Magasanikbacteria bacterium RIFCSPHIGHO2_02_FULL_41_13 TaxID=1798676 RepID=A0A1F6M6R0_9BACT|nr:MAG: hypothetical protein A3B90_00605 [Candidatus Magasanikbacteria bacterium RIFCSPHIGHO2_02_FULL_41_13]